MKNPGLYARRKLINRLAMVLATAAAAFGLAWLGAILWVLVENGISGIGAHLFTEMTPPPGAEGGLLNAMFGSLMMTGVAVVLATPIGILAGTYLAEYGRYEGGNRLGETVRFINDILLSAPSIVIGLFVYEAMVIRMGHFSGWAGAVALAVIAVPVVLRTTDDMLTLVPVGLREAAAALGAPRWKVVVKIAYRGAASGMVTGVLLAIARVSGETAPLLFTALNNQFWSANMNGPMANLPVVIFQFALSPYENWQHLAWSGALVITVTVLLLNIGARLLAAKGRMGEG